MSKPVEEGSGKAFVAKDLHPVGELQVGGDDNRDAFVKFREKGK